MGAIKRELNKSTNIRIYPDGVVLSQKKFKSESKVMVFLSHAEVAKLHNLDKRLKGLV